MDAGQLVADEIVIGMIRERLQNPDTDRGFIMDGFPRSGAQARELDAVLGSLGQPLDKALLIDVKFDALMKRLTGRRTCKDCGQMYNVYYSPPQKDGVCDRCGGRMRVVTAIRSRDAVSLFLASVRGERAPPAAQAG